MPEFAIYDVTVKTCSCLHIGNGETLLRDYDYVLHANKTWRLNLDTLLDERVPNEAAAARVARRPPGQLLHSKDFDEGSPLFRYVLPGQPRSMQTGAKVREQIKDAWDRPYLPGSSLKGALRTAILWNAVKEAGLSVTVEDLDRDPHFAAQGIETKMLRQPRQGSPNYDLLRALQVGDSQPLGQSALRLVNAQVIGGRTQRGAPIELEAIGPGVEMQVRLKIDLALFSTWAQQYGLDLRSQQRWLDDLPAWVRRHSQNLAQRGLAWCERNVDRAKLLEFYRMIERDKRHNACFLQIGWGGGWDSKTLGKLLQQDPDGFEKIAQKYKLRRTGRGQAAKPGTPFPTTRRMVVQGEKQEVLGPLGWVYLTFERRD